MIWVWKQHAADTIATLIATLATISTWVVAQMGETTPEFQKLLEHGILATLVIFFVWTSWKREERLSKRLDQLEDKLPELIERYAKEVEHCAKSMDANADAVSNMGKAVVELQHYIQTKN